MSRKERTIRTEGIVLRHNDWGEADRMLWVYTRALGKVHILAKGIRKIRSRKAGHLEPFTLTMMLLAKGRDFWIITQAETINAYISLRKDLDRLGHTAYIIELLERFSNEEEENQALYRLVVETLDRIDREPEPRMAIRYYELRLLDLLGYRPRLFQCIHCGNEIIAEDQFFSIPQGGVVCPGCATQVLSPIPITMETLKYLRHFQRSSYSEACRAHLTPEINKQIEQLMQSYLTFFLERGLNTPSFIQQVKPR
jgi:DNA repair protein RecO (recombination protein O)